MPGVVTVALKAPTGLQLRLFRMEDRMEQQPGGGARTVKMAMPYGEPVFVKGFATTFGVMPDHQIIGGFGLTHGVDADFFAEWLKQNQDLDLVRKGLIFAHKDAIAGANERSSLRSGLEPLDPLVPGKDLAPLSAG